MSTLLSLAVVALAILGVLWIALKDPDQPATARRPTPGSAPLRAPRATMSAQPAPVAPVPARERMTGGVLRPATVGASPWTRVRSGVALLVLVAVVGAMLALAVGAVLVGGALALRNAVS